MRLIMKKEFEVISKIIQSNMQVNTAGDMKKISMNI